MSLDVIENCNCWFSCEIFQESHILNYLFLMLTEAFHNFKHKIIVETVWVLIVCFVVNLSEMCGFKLRGNGLAFMSYVHQFTMVKIRLP